MQNKPLLGKLIIICGFVLFAIQLFKFELGDVTLGEIKFSDLWSFIMGIFFIVYGSYLLKQKK